MFLLSGDQVGRGELPVVVAAVALVPNALVVQAITAVLAALLRRRLAGGICGIALVAAGSVVVPRFPFRTAPVPPGPQLTVVTANVYYESRDCALRRAS